MEWLRGMWRTAGGTQSERRAERYDPGHDGHAPYGGAGDGDAGAPDAGPASAAGGAEARRAALRAEMGALGWLLLGVFLAGVLAAAAVARVLSDPADGATSAGRGPFGLVGALIARPLVALLGWTGALFVPVAPLVHALRRFGRLGARADRDWLVLLAGCAVLVPVAAALALGVDRAESAAAGLWGAFVAYYAAEWFGAFGAWLLVVFAACGLLVSTLAWNPCARCSPGEPRRAARRPTAHAPERPRTTTCTARAPQPARPRAAGGAAAPATRRSTSRGRSSPPPRRCRPRTR
jgi:hypothetical protein